MNSQHTLSILMTQLGTLTDKTFTAYNAMQNFMDQKGHDVGENQVAVPGSVGIKFLDESQSIMDEMMPIIKQVRALCITQNLELPGIIPELERLALDSLKYAEVTRATYFRVH